MISRLFRLLKSKVGQATLQVLAFLLLTQCRTPRSTLQDLPAERDLKEQVRLAKRLSDQRFFRNETEMQMLMVDYGSDASNKVRVLKALLDAVGEMRNIAFADSFEYSTEKVTKIKSLLTQPTFAEHLTAVGFEYFPEKSSPVVSLVLGPYHQATAARAINTINESLSAIRSGKSAPLQETMQALREYLDSLVKDFDQAKHWTPSYRILSMMASFATSMQSTSQHLDLATANLVSNMVHELNLITINQRSDEAVAKERATELGQFLSLRQNIAYLQDRVDVVLVDPSEWIRFYNLVDSIHDKSRDLYHYASDQAALNAVDLNVTDVRVGLDGKSRYMQYALVVGTDAEASWVGYTEGTFPHHEQGGDPELQRRWAFSDDPAKKRRWHEWSAKKRDALDKNNRQIVLVKLVECLRLMDHPALEAPMRYLVGQLNIDPAKLLTNQSATDDRKRINSADIDIDGTRYQPGSELPAPLPELTDAIGIEERVSNAPPSSSESADDRSTTTDASSNRPRPAPATTPRR